MKKKSFIKRSTLPEASLCTKTHTKVFRTATFRSAAVFRSATVFRSAAFCAAVFLLAGCGNDNESATADGNDSRVPLEVTGGISAQTRAADAAWAASDAIGIYMLKSGTTDIAESTANRRYTTAAGDGRFSADAGASIYYPIDGSKVDFLAYYPHSASGVADGKYALDLSDQSHLPAIDLMSASVSGKDKSAPGVAFNFHHLLTKLELVNTPGTGITASELEGMTVEITRQRTAASYDILFEGLNVADATATLTLNTSADGKKSAAILFPNTETAVNPIVPGRQLVFTLKTGGEKFYWNIPDDKSFNAGEKNIYTITINRSGLEVTSSITDWTSGNGTGEEGNAQ